MHNSKLIELLKTFNKEDLRAFSDFVRSPYYNKRADLIALFDYLKKQAPTFPDKKINRQKVFKYIFPNMAYDEKQIGYSMNYLHKLAEKFVGLRKYEANDFSQKTDILEGLVERRLDKHYQFLNGKNQSFLDKKQIKGSIYYFQKYQAATIANTHFLNQEIRAFDASLQDAADALDYFYLCEKLKLACEILDRLQIFQDKYQLHFESAIHEISKHTSFDENPVIAQYYQVFQLLTNANGEESYQHLKKIFLQKNNETPLVDQQKILSYGINYCARQIRNSENRDFYMEEVLTLYIYGVNKKILFSKGYLSPWHFKNMIRLGINLQKFDWVESFIKEHAQYLEEQFRQNALHYNLADLYYRKKDYPNALPHLNQVAFNDVSYAIGAREMLLRIYYETDEIESLYSLIASFTIYLKRNKELPVDVRKTYLNFCKIVSQILRMNLKNIEKIEQNIQETKLLASKNWLLEIYQKEKKILIK